MRAEGRRKFEGKADTLAQSAIIRDIYYHLAMLWYRVFANHILSCFEHVLRHS